MVPWPDGKKPRWPTNKPAQGQLHGTGWGGDAKGASMSRIVGGEDGEAIRKLAHDPEWMAGKALRAREMEAVLYVAAYEAPESAGRINAAAKLHAIIEGTPVARNVNADGGNAPAVAVRKFFQPIEDEPAA
jgi:hypothetical protein